MHTKQDKSPQSAEILEPPVNETLLAEIVRRIADFVPGCCIVLFGSYAYGEPTENSDIDLLVIVDSSEDPLVVAGDLYLRLRPRLVSIDVVVVTPEAVRQHANAYDPMLSEAISNGKVLYGQRP
jgi:predicted nucleotidyltransferase